MNSYLERAQELKHDFISIRRHLHQIPELAMDLPQTSAYVISELEKLGIHAHRVSESGIVALIGGKKGGPVFLIRADMDALNMRERSGLDFASQRDNAHTCGHDLHTTWLLGAARLLKEQEDQLCGTVKLMFQPGEEKLLGAKAMIESGILENPHVDAGMAMHVFPGDMHVGTVAWRAGPTLASSDHLHITVTGKAGHGAIPQNAIDPLNIAAHIILALQEINAREVDPQDPIVLTICTIRGGELHNAFPETVEMTGSIRAFSDENRILAKRRVIEICEGVAKAFRGGCTVDFNAGVASVHNDEQLVEELVGYVGEIADNLITLKKQMGSEDFAEVTQKIPAVFFGVGAGGAESIYHQGGSHNPKVVFNEDALPFGAAMMATCAANWLRHHYEG